ncbi:MAG: DUF1214 domain-containing protein [Chloroflexi bacterium]|nr:DUF1214 domain-containing protein [Chloroflexota bacterium]
MATDAERVMSGAAWADFCDALKAAGDVILRDNAPADELTRAEGFRYLTRLARQALEANLEDPDALWPRWHRQTHLVTYGITNPDQHHLSAIVSGKHDYRVWGALGNAAYLSLNAYSATHGRDGHLDRHELKPGPNGDVEIIASTRRHQGNWLAMSPDTTSISVRQTFLDWKTAKVTDLHIERIGVTGARPPLSADQVARGLHRAARNVGSTARRFADWSAAFAKRPNELRDIDTHLGPGTYVASGSDPQIVFFGGYYQLARDETLVVEATPPECDWWGFQVCNWWQESLNDSFPGASLNKQSAHYRPDKSVRIVIAHEDPGVSNWMNTFGHDRGIMGLRWTRAAEGAAAASRSRPTTRLVPLSEARRLRD